MDQSEEPKSKINRRVLPFLMKPATLVIMTLACIFGEVLWFYRAVQEEIQWEAIALFVVGSILGSANGRWTSKMFNDHYIDSLLKRVDIMKTHIGKKNTAFTVLALGLPLLVSFITLDEDPFLPVIQSYIFGFIGGMNIAIYHWVRMLPK